MHRDLIIVRRPSPYLPALQGAVVLGFFFFGFWLGFAAGPEPATGAASPGAVLRVPALEQELAELKDRHAALGRSYQVEHASNQQTAQSLAELESGKYRLEKEIALYKALLQPNAQAKAGLSIAGFESAALGGERYRFRLTLLDARADRKAVKGEVSLQLMGHIDGTAKTLNLAELAGLNGAALKFQFQHFHYVDGELRLPAGFKAEKVVVTLKPAERGAKKLSKEYPWLQRS